MTPIWPLAAVAGILGLVIGSFVNVVVHRVPLNLSVVKPRSRCPGCERTLRVRDNVPVLSWLALRGRCAGCAMRISVRYPLVELATAALFVAVLLEFGISERLPAFLYLVTVGLTLALIDLDARQIPTRIVLPSYVVALLLLLPAGAAAGDWWPAARGLTGMAELLVAFGSLSLACPRVVSRGDVMLAGLLGIYLGWLSWGALLIALMGTFLLVGVAGCTGLLARSAHSTGRVRPGSCLVLAAVLSVFLAAPLTGWYGSLLVA